VSGAEVVCAGGVEEGDDCCFSVWFLNIDCPESWATTSCEAWWLTTLDRKPSDPTKTSVKRIIGLPGDIVFTRRPYPYDRVEVPEGHVWVEGDYADRSLDSNTYGPISARLITGRVTHVLAPLGRAGRVRWWEHSLREGVFPAV
jgi:signal peptidase I